MERKLSKSQYTKGLNCAKALWLYRHRKDLATAADAFTESIMEAGTDFGLLARDRWPGGILIKADHLHPEEAIAETAAALDAGANTLYEAAFLFEDVLVRVDVMVRLGPPSAGNIWQMFEVKSGTKVEEVHLKDVAIQRFVVEGAGHRVAQAFVVHANGGYVRRGPLDLKELFAIEDVTKASAEDLAAVPGELARMKTYADAEAPPPKPIGAHCTTPYPCDFKAHCWAGIPKYSVFNLTGARMDKKLELFNSGVQLVNQINPRMHKLTAAQVRQVEAARSGERRVNLAEVRAFLAALRYPLAHLDFETDNPVIPPYDGLRPYSQMAFQASVRVQAEPGAPVVERGILGDGLDDPRWALSKFLCEVLPASGSVLAYHKSFEEGRLTELARHTRIEYLDDIAKRLQDLADPFRTGAYVHPGFEGRWSIKAVLPVLAPDLSYKTLAIQDGAQAMAAYARLRDDKALSGVEREAIMRQLREYCGQDTEAMVRILAHLYEVAGKVPA